MIPISMFESMAHIALETPIGIKKILMPIDRSGYREKILAYGISLGKAWGQN